MQALSIHIIRLICARFWLIVRILFFYFICFLTLPAFAQVGGQKSFEFLNVPNHARLGALGGVNVSLADRDLNFFYSNPSLISDTLAEWASASYQLYLADVGQATFSYAHRFKRAGTIAFGVQHIGYGNIKSYDAYGQELGDVKSGETALVVSKSHQIGNFRFGVNLKGVFSNVAGYHANALLFDLGGVFIHPKKNITVGLAMKNLGMIFSEYTETSSTKLPFDVQLGVTFKPEHMPLRFSVTGYNLVRSNITYYDSQSGGDKPGALDQIFRRFNFGAEILIHRNVNLMVGYNYLIHQELKLSTGGGGAGVAVGFSARIKSTELVFSRSGYVAGNGGYTFTISLDTHKLLIRR